MSRIRNFVALAAAALVVPALTAAALPLPTAVFALADEGSMDALVFYYDGLGSTKIAFSQFQGSTGQADDRLSPGAICTEWHGTFHNVVVKAGSSDNAQSAHYVIANALATTPDAQAERDDVGWVLDATGAGPSIHGTLQACDNPSGAGVAFLRATGGTLPLETPHPSIVRIKEVG